MLLSPLVAAESGRSPVVVEPQDLRGPREGFADPAGRWRGAGQHRQVAYRGPPLLYVVADAEEAEHPGQTAGLAPDLDELPGSHAAVGRHRGPGQRVGDAVAHAEGGAAGPDRPSRVDPRSGVVE